MRNYDITLMNEEGLFPDFQFNTSLTYLFQYGCNIHKMLCGGGFHGCSYMRGIRLICENLRISYHVAPALTNCLDCLCFRSYF